MKKLMFFAAAAAMTLSFASCGGEDNDGDNNGPAKTFEAAVTLTDQIPSALVYGEPVVVKGSVATDKTLTKYELTAVKGTEGAYTPAGDSQSFEAKDKTIDALFFPDTKDATAVELKLYAGNMTSTTYYPVTGVTGESKGAVWINRSTTLIADNKVKTHDNSPEEYPEVGQGAGSTTKSFFSMHGVQVGSEKKHIVSLDELRAVDGANGSMCFLNVLENTSKPTVTYIGGQRGYSFSTLKASSLAGGTMGRQCDIYEVNGKGIKDANVELGFTFYAVPGSWKEGRSDEAVARFTYVDALFAKLPKTVTTTADKMRASYMIGALQRDLDNATLGVTENPTSLPLTTFARRWADAGHTQTKNAVENFRAGDYIICRSKRGTDENPVYYYGIMQITNLNDDKDTFVANTAPGKESFTYIDQVKAVDLFGKGITLDIRIQCEE